VASGVLFLLVDRAAFQGSNGRVIAVAHLNEIRMNLITKGVE
jgi:hypothetical protein